MFQSTKEKKEPFSKFNWKLKHFLEIFSPVVIHLFDMTFSFVNKAGLKLLKLSLKLSSHETSDWWGIKFHEIKLIKLCIAPLFCKAPLLAKPDGTKYSANYAECSSLALSNICLGENTYWIFLVCSCLWLLFRVAGYCVVQNDICSSICI